MLVLNKSLRRQWKLIRGISLKHFQLGFDIGFVKSYNLTNINKTYAAAKYLNDGD